MTLTLKPVGAACNMRCRYCYYVDKFTGDPTRTSSVMSTQTLETAIRKYAETLPADQEMSFLWHGGEPMLMPLQFYKDALDIQKKYSGGRKIFNSIQTNGTLITQEWADFLAREKWLTGISIDGSPFMNDSNRRYTTGAPTSEKVLEGIRKINRAAAQWNAMATVNHTNVYHPEEFYDYLKSLGTQFIQFSPIAERINLDGYLCSPDSTGQMTKESITPEQWGEFLCRVFDRWSMNDIGKVYVQVFDATLAGYIGATPGVCILSPQCGMNPVVEANGDIYCCDHFVFDDYRIGNIMTDDLNELMERIADFGQAKNSTLSDDCKKCPYLNICHGECPKNRFVSNGNDGKMNNYLCSGYKRYFEYSQKFMQQARDAIFQTMR